ncbi:hypothetical protein V6Z12_D06G074900 [Gossypium hirsutum]
MRTVYFEINNYAYQGFLCFNHYCNFNPFVATMTSPTYI